MTVNMSIQSITDLVLSGVTMGKIVMNSVTVVDIGVTFPVAVYFNQDELANNTVAQLKVLNRQRVRQQVVHRFGTNPAGAAGTAVTDTFSFTV